mmetsp:Transcript_39641/g.38195  ORF Transcript_39641/g.38195 Transcript_39641/m.38195 type:complete len:88 (+) Transcript_39641:2036-2299(+)
MNKKANHQSNRKSAPLNIELPEGITLEDVKNPDHPRFYVSMNALEKKLPALMQLTQKYANEGTPIPKSHNELFRALGMKKRELMQAV